MTDRPIRFSGPMVRALLAGTKTQTRRVLKKPSWAQDNGWPERIMDEQDLDGRLSWFASETGCLSALPIPQPGDRLWVREAWATERAMDSDSPSQIGANCLEAGYERPWAPLLYMADEMVDNRLNGTVFGRTRASMHMPRWASRLTLTVTDLRVQRMQEISYLDTCAEGVDCETCAAMGRSACYRKGCAASREAFRSLWDSLNAPRGYGWDANPWVAAYTFTVQRRNIDQVDA